MRPADINLSAPEEDLRLWSEIQNGNVEAFDSLYRKFVRPLYFLVSKRIEDKIFAEDIVQDVFLTLWEKRHVYKPQGALYAYLCGMAINRVLNHFRTQRLKPAHVELWDTLSEEAIGLHELSLAFGQAHNEEMENLLELAIGRLTPRLKEIYFLRFEHEQSVKEISERLMLSPNTVYNQLDQIKKRFLSVLKETSYYTFL